MSAADPKDTEKPAKETWSLKISSVRYGEVMDQLCRKELKEQ